MFMRRCAIITITRDGQSEEAHSPLFSCASKGANAMEARDVTFRKLAKAKADMQTAGPIHRRDLFRHIQRLERQLRRTERTADSSASRRT